LLRGDEVLRPIALFFSLLKLSLFLSLFIDSVLLVELTFKDLQVIRLDLDVIELRYLLSRLLNDSGRQVDLKLVWDSNALGFAIDKALGQLLPICFVASIVLDLDVQVDGTFRGVHAAAVGVGTLKLALKLVHLLALVNLPATLVSFGFQLCHVGVVKI